MREITHISCVGAGLIGQGWATQFCSGGYDLILYDLNETILDNALRQKEAYWMKRFLLPSINPATAGL